jgi:hypothetical protein
MTPALHIAGPSFLLLCVLFELAWITPSFARDDTFDTQIYTDPYIPVTTVEKVFHKRLVPLWLQALERPENDLKRQAAASIALAHKHGLIGLEKTEPLLLKTLDYPEQHITVRLAVAQALIELDARQAAANLFAHSQTDGIDMRNLVEPALARWDYQPARTVWLARINQPGLAGSSWIMAIQGLSAVKEAKAIPRLRELIFAPDTDPIVRLEAGKALGLLQVKGLEKDAERLAQGKAEPGNVAHLVAASLLRMHRGDAAAAILQHLALGADPATARLAIEGLLQDDPRRLVLLIPQLSANSDASVREGCIEGFRRSPALGPLPLVADLMDDPHPRARASARKALAEVAKKADFREAILSQAKRWLATESWRALEQATILMVDLDYKAAAPRLVKLLRFERPEVFIAAAWGLRKLAVPETLPDQLQEIERRLADASKRGTFRVDDYFDEQLAHLCESLGWAKYEPAVPTLRRFIPKRMLMVFGPKCRIAAIWALGRDLEKNPPESLVQELLDRITDIEPRSPEDMGVRTMCAISLGRMKAKAAFDDLNGDRPMQKTAVPFTNACAWALEQITGKPQPIAEGERAFQMGWFLEPDRR